MKVLLPSCAGENRVVGNGEGNNKILLCLKWVTQAKFQT